MKFVSLHHHSTFSCMDGFGLPEEHFERAAELGMSALATTEHGNINSHVKVEQAAAKTGLKPIYGVEAYTAKTKTRLKWHLTMLAENAVGYQNLMQSVSQSGTPEDFYQWPTMTSENLAAHAEGMIVLSGCASSRLSCSLLGGKGAEPKSRDLHSAERTARLFRDVYGDGYYLEVQAFPELERTRELNAAYEIIGRRLGIPLVATCDVHYPHADDNEIQKILHTAGRGLGTVGVAEEAWEYDLPLTLPESDRGLLDRLVASGLSTRAASQALASTVDIAARCNVALPRAERLRFPTELGSREQLWEELRAGWRARAAEFPERFADDAYCDRLRSSLRYEMEVIGEKDFDDYFLVVGDSVRWAKQQNIGVGPARGSAAASTVCWILRITEIDPLLYPAMMFERFIDPSRDDMPDIDLDFDHGRDRVRQYLVETYGEDRVGNVQNYVRMRGKGAVQTVARAYDIPPWETSALRDVITNRPESDDREFDSVIDAIEMFPAAREVLDKHPELKYAIRLEGTIGSYGVHAAGLVVAASPLSDVCATVSKEVGKTKRRVTALAYDKRDAEHLGMLKLDYLAVTTMDAIGAAIELAGLSWQDLYQLDLDDPVVFDAFCAGDTVGIFQWDGATTSSINSAVQPREFMALADINALSRPGPLFGGQTEEYIRAKKTGDFDIPHPIVGEHTARTFGQIVYQEQILAVVRDLGNFAPREVGNIRRVIGKKKGAGAFNKLRAEFLAGAQTHDCDVATGEKIWNGMVSAAGYAFNVSHSVSYSVVAYWAQWLKQYHPDEMFTGALRFGDKDTYPRLVRDAGHHHVRVLGIDLEESTRTWELFNTHIGPSYIRAGWEQVDGIAEKTANAIEAVRPITGFTDWSEIAAVPGIGPVTIAKLRDAAERNDPAGTKALRSTLTVVRTRLRTNTIGLPAPTHTSEQIPGEATKGIVWVGFVDEVQRIDEVESEHKRTGRSFDEILSTLKDPELRKSIKVHCHDDGNDSVTLRVNRWSYPDYADDLENLSSGDLVLVRAERKKGLYKTLHVRDFWNLGGMKHER